MYVAADVITLLSSWAATAMVNTIIAASALVLLTSLCLRWLPSLRPSDRFIVWTTVLTATLLLPFASASKPVGSAIVPTDPFHLDPRWALGIAVLWAFLAAIRLVRLVHSAVYLRRISIAARPVTTDSALAALLATSRRSPQLCVSSDINRPCVAGFFSPKILIPEELYPKLSSLELEQIIRHEMEHIRRWDDWTNIVQKFGLCLFPLNPILGWIERRLCIERELACDDCVLSAIASPKSYALCLTNLAEHSFLRRNLALALGALGKRSELVYRVNRILTRPSPTFSRRQCVAVTALVVAGLASGAFSLTHLPTLVSFSPQAPAQAHRASFSPVRAVIVPAAETAPRGVPAPTLVKAIMDTPVRPVSASVQQHRSPAARTKARRSAPAVPRPRMLQTRLEQYSGQGVTLTIYRMNSSYATVSIENDWLFVQL